MAKYRYGFDEAKILKYQKEGRGEGHDTNYKPWLTIQDVPSLGRRTRLYGSRFNRGHHLLSDIETSAFLLFHWSDAVTDIREQFPIDRERTRSIASALGIAHPRDKDSRTDLVMTVGLLVDAAGKCLPVSCKTVSELGEKRTLEKLEIERRACLELWGSWTLMTESDYSKQFIQSLEWIHEHRLLDHLEAPHPSYWQDCCNYVMGTLAKAPSMTLAAAFAATESRHGMRKGDALAVYRHLLATKVISTDLNTPYRSDAPVASIKFNNAMRADRSAA